MAFIDSVRALDKLSRIQLAQYLIESFFDVMEKENQELSSKECLDRGCYLIELYQQQMSLCLGELERDLEKLHGDMRV